MGYSGHYLPAWFDNQGALTRAMHRIADRGGERMTTLVRMNTPVEHGTLRASWEQKLTVVHVDALGRLVYESGTETEVEYAPYVEHGTGLWGPRHAKYVIRPRRPDGWLRWIDPQTGDPVFAKRVMHPGSPGNHMVAIGVALTEHEFLEFSRDPLRELMRDLERSILRHRVVNSRRVF